MNSHTVNADEIEAKVHKFHCIEVLVFGDVKL